MKTSSTFFCVTLLSALAVAQDDTGWDAENAIVPQRTSVIIKDQVEISADVPGKITFLQPNERGKMVKEGEVVVRLDSTVIEAQFAEVEAKAKSQVLIDFAQKSLDLATAKLESKRKRNRDAFEKTGVNVFSDDEMRQLELEEIKADAELKKATEDRRFAELAVITKSAELAQFTIRSGFSGMVTDTHKKSVGSAVRQGDPILTVVSLNEVYAKLSIRPAENNRVNIGDKVLVRLRNSSPVTNGGGDGKVFSSRSEPPATLRPAAIRQAAPVKTFVGEVSYIGKSDFDTENLIEVFAVIKNEEVAPGKFLLREGSFIDARILSP